MIQWSVHIVGIIIGFCPGLTFKKSSLKIKMQSGFSRIKEEDALLSFLFSPGRALRGQRY